MQVIELWYQICKPKCIAILFGLELKKKNRQHWTLIFYILNIHIEHSYWALIQIIDYNIIGNIKCIGALAIKYTDTMQVFTF